MLIPWNMSRLDDRTDVPHRSGNLEIIRHQGKMMNRPRTSTNRKSLGCALPRWRAETRPPSELVDVGVADCLDATPRHAIIYDMYRSVKVAQTRYATVYGCESVLEVIEWQRLDIGGFPSVPCKCGLVFGSRSAGKAREST